MKNYYDNDGTDDNDALIAFKMRSQKAFASIQKSDNDKKSTVKITPIKVLGIPSGYGYEQYAGKSYTYQWRKPFYVYRKVFGIPYKRTRIRAGMWVHVGGR